MEFSIYIYEIMSPGYISPAPSIKCCRVDIIAWQDLVKGFHVTNAVSPLATAAGKILFLMRPCESLGVAIITLCPGAVVPL